MLQLSQSATLLDIGAGIGYFSIPISKEIRSVIALDFEPKMFEVLSGRMKSLRVSNIHLLRGDMLSLPLADGSVDHVFAAFVYHEVASTRKLIHECRRVLGTHGRLTILDFQKKETGVGPPVSERKTPAQVLRAVSGKFKLISRTDEDVYYILNLAKLS
jgi:ubiquinone/menaquinone biosynthesis C-methylase UbiE